MPTCHYCGDEIEFRYVDGSPTPIHINGGWCSGAGERVRSNVDSAFSSTESYLNPNAHCPICGDHVYFFRCKNGGRVFFDDVGWPWPKHGCTDHSGAQRGPVKSYTARVRRAFLFGGSGKALEVYLLDELQIDGDIVRLKFRDPDISRAFRAVVTLQDMLSNSITTEDLEGAPSFVIDAHENHREIAFISERLKRIVTFSVARMKRA